MGAMLSLYEISAFANERLLRGLRAPRICWWLWHGKFRNFFNFLFKNNSFSMRSSISHLSTIYPSTFLSTILRKEEFPRQFPRFLFTIRHCDVLCILYFSSGTHKEAPKTAATAVAVGLCCFRSKLSTPKPTHHITIHPASTSKRWNVELFQLSAGERCRDTCKFCFT